jgi:predicted O-methyltransferase YrrM
MPDFNYSLLKPYLDSIVPERHEELEKMEAYAAEHDFPIVGPASGQLCYILARMCGAKRVCELGSGYGYSTAWFASAVQDNGGGMVRHIVWDDELSAMARKHLGAMGFCDGENCRCGASSPESSLKSLVDGSSEGDGCTCIEYTMGEAVEALTNDTGQPYDIIFCDIDKEGYPAALPVVEKHINPGGILIVDNMIWGGRVMDDAEQEEETKAIRELTQTVTNSSDWDAMIAPIRDGLLIARRR